MLTYAKQDTFCKDVVNIRKEVKTEGVARVSFLGAGGHEIQIDCPKVSLSYVPRFTAAHPHCSQEKCLWALVSII